MGNAPKSSFGKEKSSNLGIIQTYGGIKRTFYKEDGYPVCIVQNYYRERKMRRRIPVVSADKTIISRLANILVLSSFHRTTNVAIQGKVIARVTVATTS